MGDALTLFMQDLMPTVSSSRLVNVSIVSDNASQITALQRPSMGRRKTKESGLFPRLPDRASSAPVSVGGSKPAQYCAVRSLSVPVQDYGQGISNSSNGRKTVQDPLSGTGSGRWEIGESDSDSFSHRRRLVQPIRHASAEKPDRLRRYRQGPGRKPTRSRSQDEIILYQ